MRLKSETVSVNGFKISFTVNVDKGFFTTLPHIVKLIENAGINLNRNQLNNHGYFSDITYTGLYKQVKDIIIEYMSRELISEKIVIKYCINSLCTYAIDENKNI